MNRPKTFAKFLSTFDGAAAAPNQAPPAAVSALPAQQVPPGYVPVSELVPQIINLADARRRHEEERARTDAAAAPAAPATNGQPASSEDLREEVRSLTRQLAQSNKQALQMQLEVYRTQAISRAQAAGTPVIESLVGGRTPAEVDASITLAAAEYQHLSREWFRNFAAQNPGFAQQQPQPPANPVPQPAYHQQPQQPPQAPAPMPAPAPVPQGYVMSQAPMPVQPQPQPLEAPQPIMSAPGFMATPGIPNAPDSAISQEQLAYLTSFQAMHNGDYAKNRHVLMAALRANAGMPAGFAFNPGYSFAPGTPQHGAPAQIAQAPAQPPPAMQSNMYAGVMQPNVQMPPGMLAHAQPAYSPQMPQMPAYAPAPPPMQPMGAMPYAPQAAQPAQLDAGAPLDANAARAAALNAVSHRRALGDSNMPAYRNV